MVNQIENDEKYKDIWDNENYKTSLALFAMSAFGVGEFVSGPMHGKIIDKYGYNAGIFTVIATIIIGGCLTIENCMRLNYGFHSYVMTFLWGITDGVINIQIFTTLSQEFVESAEPFGAFNLMQGLAVFIFQIVQG